jgi:hypothetical protein
MAYASRAPSASLILPGIAAPAVSIALFARHGPSRGFRDDEISRLAAASIAPRLSRGIPASPAYGLVF